MQRTHGIQCLQDISVCLSPVVSRLIKKTTDAFEFVVGNSVCVGLASTKYVETNDSIVTSLSICEYMIVDKLNILHNLMVNTYACGVYFLAFCVRDPQCQRRKPTDGI